MTIKNSLISVAAASLLIAGLAGCGSSSSSSSSSTSSSTSGGIQSSVNAVDGYIYNATVKAYYVTDDNSTMGSVTLTATPTTKNTSTLVSTVGGHTYSLSAADDANASIKDRIRFFTVATTSSVDDGNVTFTPAAYIEADGEAGYDANDTLIGTTVLYAPATSSVVSPLTDLIYQSNTATLGTTTTAGTAAAELNASIIAAIDANATKIATNLGLGSVNLLTADPVDLASSNPTLKLVTALFKSSTSTASTVSDAVLAMTTPATTLATTLAGVVAALPTGNAKTFATELQTLAVAGAFTTSDVAALNIEKSVATGTYTTTAIPTFTGKFPVSGVDVGTKKSTVLSAAGAKYLSTDTVDVNMTLAAANADANISNTSFKLLVAFKGKKDFVSDDANISSSIVASIPFDLNLTTSGGSTGVVATAGIAATSLIPYQVKSQDGSETVAKTDINASTVGLATTDIRTNVTTNILTINVGNIVTALKSIGDGNTTTDLETFNGISDVQVMIADASGKIMGAKSATVTLPLAKATFSDIGLGSITGVEAYKLVALPTLDMRTGVVTAANAAPDNNLSISGALVNSGAGSLYDTNATARIVLNNNTRYSITLDNSTSDSWEDNTTAAFTFGAMLTDQNSSYLSDRIKKDSTSAVTATNALDVNTSDTTTAGELNTTISTVITDEFGETNTTVTYITVNRAPTYKGTETNTTRYLIANDKDGHDINGSLDVVVYFNGFGGGLSLTEGTALEVNLTQSTADTNRTITLYVDPSDGNNSVYVDFNASLPADHNITFDVNLTDEYDGDLNVTGQVIVNS